MISVENVTVRYGERGPGGADSTELGHAAPDGTVRTGSPGDPGPAGLTDVSFALPPGSLTVL